MGWLTQLQGQTVALDTAPLIFYIERNPSYIDYVRPFFVSLGRGEFRVVTSVITLLEVLVHPLRRVDDALAHQYNDILLSSPNITVHSVTNVVAQEAAELRARFNLKTPDAVQLATALLEKATIFFTNDHSLSAECGINILRLTDIASQDSD